ALSLRPSEDGFMVKTTWRLRMTCPVNHLYSSSLESSMSPSRWDPSLHWVIRVLYSSPSKRPGTSPLASSVFMRSRNDESSTLPSSSTKQIFSPCAHRQMRTLQPDRLRTERRSSSKSAALYLLWTLIWKTLRPFIQATKRESVVLPAPLTPINSR
ncbi:unnamed protein product, partial [Ixodes pacificus]